MPDGMLDLAARAGGASLPLQSDTGVRAAGILGLGHYVPARVITNADMESVMSTTDEWIRERTGIRQRHMAAPHQNTADLAVEAAGRCLADAGCPADEVDAVIVSSATHDYPTPATASVVQGRLGARRAAAFDVSAACSGFLYALTVADGLVRAGIFRLVLVIGSETLSRIADWSDRGTAVLLGDGAGAALVGPVGDGEGILASHLGSDGTGWDLIQVVPGAGAPSPFWDGPPVGHHHFRQNGREVYRFATQIVGQAAERALAQAGLRLEDVDLFIPHQANGRIIEAAARRMGLPMDRVWVNIDRLGNTSSACIPIALSEAKAARRLPRGAVVLAVAFGGGLTWAGVVMRWV
jgi:3-oxoacyl-[acyl-carrier-protein] synthase-3